MTILGFITFSQFFLSSCNRLKVNVYNIIMIELLHIDFGQCSLSENNWHLVQIYFSNVLYGIILHLHNALENSELYFCIT